MASVQIHKFLQCEKALRVFVSSYLSMNLQKFIMLFYFIKHVYENGHENA